LRDQHESGFSGTFAGTALPFAIIFNMIRFMGLSFPIIFAGPENFPAKSRVTGAARPADMGNIAERISKQWIGGDGNTALTLQRNLYK